MLDNHLDNLLTADELLAGEYFDHLKEKILIEPEKRLLFAVLNDAVCCFQDNLLATDPRRKKFFTEAEEWILDAANDGVFSFDNICAMFGITPQYLRRGLMRWKQEKLLALRTKAVENKF